MWTLVLLVVVILLAGVAVWQWRVSQAQAAILHKPRVVEAVLSAASVRQNPERAKQIERAMSQAVTDAMRNGVSLQDADAIRAAILAARQRVLNGDQ